MKASAANHRCPRPQRLDNGLDVGPEHSISGLARRRGFAPRMSGFTLIELMIVMAIIVILVSLVVPNYRTSLIKSREAVLRDQLFTLNSLIEQYTLDKSEAPQ